MNRRSFLKGIGAAAVMPALSGMTPQQLAILSGPRRPGWVSPAAVYADNYVTGEYWRAQGGIVGQAQQLVTTRSSGINLPNTAGVYQSLGNNTLPRTDRGLYANGQFTNKITANNLTPGLVTPVGVSAFNALGLTGVSAGHGGGASTGLFGIVDDAAALTAAGLANISNGRAYSISLGGAVGSAFMIFGPAVGNTNPHSWGMWARCTGANATLRMVGGGSYGTVSLEPSANYQFVKFENFTPDATAQFRPQIPFGSTLLIAGMQLLESRFIPDARMVTPGAPALLASDIRAVQGVRPSNSEPEPFAGWEAAGLNDGLTVLLDFENRMQQDSSRTAVSLTNASNVVVAILNTSSAGTSFRLTAGGGSDTFPGSQTGGRSRAACRVMPDGAFAMTQEGQGSVITGTKASPINLASAGLLTIGNRPGGTEAWNDWIYELQICKPLSDAELLDWVNA